MAVIGTIWGDFRQRQTKVIHTIAALNQLELELPPPPFPDNPAVFMEKFPYGKIPAFEGTDGFKMIEGTPIARYLCSIGTKVNLLGSNVNEAAIVNQWVHFAEYEIGTPTFSNSNMILGRIPFNREVLDKYAEHLIRSLDYLESHLAQRPSGHVALDTLTLADLVVASTVYAAARVTLGSAERARYPHIFAHYEQVTGDERVKQYWGTNGFVDVRLTEPTPA